jgi:hypothetical protein
VLLGKNAAKKQTEERRSEDAGKYDQSDSKVPHGQYCLS